MKRALVIFAAFATEPAGALDSPPIQAPMRVALVDAMPDELETRALPDWRQRALDFDSLAFDEAPAAPHLPLLRCTGDAGAQFTLPSYAGGPGGGEAICCLAAVMSGSLAGVDKTDHRGRNWVRMCDAWFSPAAGVVFNNIGAKNAGASFWYLVLPGVLHAQIALLHPKEDRLNAHLRWMADRYREVVVALGGPEADFNHTGFDFIKNAPVDNGKWREPDAAAGIAYVEYAAWTRWHEPKHLETARWCLDFLQRRKREEGSPLYETLLYYAPALAAKLNRDHGARYDVAKLLDWCLASNSDPPGARRYWGVVARKFGDLDVHGLQGSTREGDGYAFAMNTFHAAGALAPLARYDPRFAEPIAKWLTHAAVNARLFFPNQMPAARQSNPELRESPLHCIPYEGIREFARLPIPWSLAGAAESAGTAAERRKIILRCDRDGRLAALFELAIPAGFVSGTWRIGGAAAHPGAAFRVHTSEGIQGPWTAAGGFSGGAAHPNGHFTAGGPLPMARGTRKAWLKIEAAGRHDPGEPLALESIDLRAALAISPWACGDAFSNGKGPTDLAVYGGAYIGYLAAVASRPARDGVMLFDVSTTDFLSGGDPRTWLCYNPTPSTRTVSPSGALSVRLEPFAAALLHERRPGHPQK